MKKLHGGDKVALVAPSGQIGSFAKIAKGVEYLQSLDLEPVYGAHLYAQNRYMAGSDSERAADINVAFADPAIKAIFCVRAAAGATRILPYIDYAAARANPKPIIGFCDNAALLTALAEKSAVPALNGFSLTYDFRGEKLDETIAAGLTAWLNGEKLEVKSGRCVHGGTSTGKLLPINLSVLLRLAGTPYFPSLAGKILLIEEVHERLHKIDLMLQQLKQIPEFAELNGLILGQFTDCSGDAEDGLIDDCLADFTAGITLPTVSDFNFGHTPSRQVLPVGATVQLAADTATLIAAK